MEFVVRAGRCELYRGGCPVRALTELRQAECDMPAGTRLWFERWAGGVLVDASPPD